MSTMTTSSAREQRVAVERLWWVTLLAIAAAAIANLIVYAIATALFATPRQFSYLTPLNIVVSTAIYLIVAAIVYAVIGRFARRPIRVFRVVAIVALVLSFAMPLSAMQLTPPADTTTVAILLVMYIVAAIITVGLFTTLARAPSEERA
jgi:MFS family permease